MCQDPHQTSWGDCCSQPLQMRATFGGLYSCHGLVLVTVTTFVTVATFGGLSSCHCFCKHGNQAHQVLSLRCLMA
jgi:hypothetical protein